jgi:hypothetical protein
MAIREFRCNIEAAHFPLLSSYFGRSVAVRSPDDGDYIVTDSFSGTAANDEIGIAQPIYMHNVLPVSHGLQSVGYKVELDNSMLDNTDFDQAIILRTRNEQQHILAPAAGRNYVNKFGTNWNTGVPSAAIKLGGIVTKAYVSQRTFICYERNGIFEYDPTTGVLNPVLLNGVTDTDFDGICYSNNFLIAYTSDTVFWSSTLDPLDFQPSLSNGASSSKLTFVRGAIVAVLPIHNGFVIYTTRNAVSAYWSGELQAPWVFREIPGAAGITSTEHVSHDSNYGAHFAWTNSGFMQISKEAGVVSFPEITDFLTCGRLEEYIDDVNHKGKGTAEFASTAMASETQVRFNSGGENLAVWKYTTPLKIKMAFIGSRFICISYGMNNQLTHILVYDLALKRWGKLRASHVDVFEYHNPVAEIATTVKHSFGLLRADGTILTVDFAHDVLSPDSVLLFGRIQHSRSAMTTMLSASFDGIIYKSTKARFIPSFDGATSLPDYYPVCVIHNNNTLKVAGRLTAKSFMLKLAGSFSISNLQVQVESAQGDR